MGRDHQPPRMDIVVCRHFLAGKILHPRVQTRQGHPPGGNTGGNNKIASSNFRATTTAVGVLTIVPVEATNRIARPTYDRTNPPPHNTPTSKGFDGTTAYIRSKTHRRGRVVNRRNYSSSIYLPSAAARAAQTSSTTLSLPQTTWPFPGLRMNSSFRSPRTTPRA